MLAKDRIDMTMMSLVSQSHHFQSVLQDAARVSTEISAHINQVITRMQFQDLAKQRLDHVIDGMTVISAGLGELGGRTRAALPAGAEAAFPQEWLDRLLSGMTLERTAAAFRAAHAAGRDRAGYQRGSRPRCRLPDVDASYGGGDNDDNIELF